MSLIRRFVWILLAAGLGWCVGGVSGMIGHVARHPGYYPFLARLGPVPHHVPNYQDGVSFRFAMVQDVIHERFAKHGPSHYRERDRITREALNKLAADDPARFALDDDLGVGLDRLGRSDEAIAVLREKLARQKVAGLKGLDLYTSYANLGTFLIHGNYKAAVGGDVPARKRFEEGLGLIRRSVEVNPEAHFGREQWQATIAEFLLATIDDPKLLQTHDFLGNDLGVAVKDILDREGNWMHMGWGRAFDLEFAKGKGEDELPAFFVPGIKPDDPARWAEFSPIRQHITKVGAETGWESVAVPSHRSPVAFDEPMLGIIGMWRQGGGANPHFALAIGETMIRVGQRHIAWAAFERAFRLADRYSPNPETREFLRKHCRKRQAEIEQTPKFPRAEVARAAFEKELAFGEGYQRDYQAYEASKIEGGFSIDDPNFFDQFPRQNVAIASESGPEEVFADVLRERLRAYLADRSRAWSIFGAGLAAMMMAGVIQLRSVLRSKPVWNAKVAS